MEAGSSIWLPALTAAKSASAGPFASTVPCTMVAFTPTAASVNRSAATSASMGASSDGTRESYDIPTALAILTAMATALVTGSTGFVGSHLVDVLLEKGWRVLATDRGRSNLRWLEGKPVERIDDATSPLPACDVLFHVAGVIRADTYADYLAGNRDLAVR